MQDEDEHTRGHEHDHGHGHRHDHEHGHGRDAAHELIHAFRQLRNVPWNGRNPIANCTPSETMTLFFIRRATRDNPGGIKASELGSMLNVASPTITQSVNLLTAKGLLRRITDPRDRRAVRITLTDEGERLTGLAHEAMHERMNALVAFLGTERADQLVGLLQDIFTFYRSLDGDDPEAPAGPWCRPGWNRPVAPNPDSNSNPSEEGE